MIFNINLLGSKRKDDKKTSVFLFDCVKIVSNSLPLLQATSFRLNGITFRGLFDIRIKTRL